MGAWVDLFGVGVSKSESGEFRRGPRVVVNAEVIEQAGEGERSAGPAAPDEQRPGKFAIASQTRLPGHGTPSVAR